MNILILNGPNLNLLGVREPAVYGVQTLQDIQDELTRDHPEVTFSFFQSNHEGAIIDALQETLRTALAIGAGTRLKLSVEYVIYRTSRNP